MLLLFFVVFLRTREGFLYCVCMQASATEKAAEAPIWLDEWMRREVMALGGSMDMDMGKVTRRSHSNPFIHSALQVDN